VEVLCPIRDKRLAEHLHAIVLGAYLRDTDRARQLKPDGHYVPTDDEMEGPPISAQDLLLEWHAADVRAGE
jgi:polyphosphate kinase